MGKKRKAFTAALPYTLPICIGFLAIGMSYGFYAASRGLSFFYPLLTASLIFAGSMEFVTVGLLFVPFNPLGAFILTLMVNARHLFYGISMLEKFRGLGWKKPLLIFGMCDETFAINSVVTIPYDVDRGWFMLFVTILNYLYWVAGATLGGLLGQFIKINTQGIEFVMTALFTVMFVEQWQKTKNHRPALAGLALSFLALFIFGAESFLIPAMVLILLCFSLAWKREQKQAREGEA